MVKYRHIKSGRIQTFGEWMIDEEMIKEAGGSIYSVQERIDKGILEAIDDNGLSKTDRYVASLDHIDKLIRGEPKLQPLFEDEEDE